MRMWARGVRTANGKLLSWLGFVLAAFFFFLFMAGTMAAEKAQCYDSDVENYFDTESCSQYVYDYFVRDAWDWYSVGRYNVRNASQFDGDPNFTFALTDGRTDARLYANADDPDAEFGGWYCLLTDDKGQLMGYTWTSGNSAVRPGSSGNIETLMECYFSEDIGKSIWGAELLRQEKTFDALYNARLVLPSGAAVCGVLCIVFAALLLLGAGHISGKEGISFCWYDSVPAEFGLLISVGLAYLVTTGGINLLLRVWKQLAEQHFLGAFQISAASCCFTVALCLIMAWILSFARYAKTGRAFQNFFVVKQAAQTRSALEMIPLTWKIGVAVAFLAAGNFVGYKLFQLSAKSAVWFSAFLWSAAVLAWGAVWLFSMSVARDLKRLQTAGENIAEGNYDTKIETANMLAPFRGYADTLSHIGAGMNEAVATQIKSERLKAELITNVSHDLKTPLTSIINYTDLLRHEQLPERAEEYTKVLSRQGEKLKKLTEDLIDASKASSGAMPCHKMHGSLDELCRQALGEYQEKLDAAHLEPVLDLPEEGLSAVFDGRLTWRVLDNLLSNACKYAMPGTRLYITGEVTEEGTVLSVKNVSATPLNTTPDELMERFVRGDSSRTSEGSGLGLSIARSLTELQGAAFRLTVDGDLFKAEMCFPAKAEEETAENILPTE